MAINPVNNVDTKTHKPYKDAKGAVNTSKNIRPLAPQGHLVHDTFLSVPKFFIKDFMYDMKAVKDGFMGNANDHQSGRLNDVGLKVGGIGIATVLAARTKNPVLRIMEYVGLGGFLTAMSLFPLAAINGPSRVVQGFDIGKEYIDDQGRKKSVFQDPNYIPWDMYRGDYPGEDFDVIGDRMGIPRGIKNRDELIKEQMRKIANQNNTLWMLTAGFGTPVMAALLCCGAEKLIAPAVEKARNSIHDHKIAELLQKTSQMTDSVEGLSSNRLSKDVAKILNNYKDKELPTVEYEKLVKLLTKDMDANASEGIKDDLARMFNSGKNGSKSYALADTFTDDVINSIKGNIPSRNKTLMEQVFVPSVEEVNGILSRFDSKQLTQEQLEKLKGEFRALFDRKMASETGASKDVLKAYSNDVIEKISKNIQKTPSKYVTENNIKDVTDFAKVLGEFKQNNKQLMKSKSFKVEYAPETVLAKSYDKFEKTLFEVLDIKFNEMKQIRDSETFAKEIFDKKLEALTKDEAKYQKGVEKLSKVISEMEVKLNGAGANESYMKDLISAIENNYNNTARRLNKIGKFNSTIDRLVKEDVNTLKNTVTSRQDLFDLLDGTRKPNKELKGLDYVKYSANGVGSSKNQTITRIVERYQGVKNSFHRILHTFDTYKRTVPEGEYNKAIFTKGKEALLSATSSEHTLKLHTHNNPEFYKDIGKTIWREGLEESTKNGLEVSKNIADGDVLGRFNKYVKRFKDVIFNNDIDFTKPQHIINPNAPKEYTKSSVTRMAKFNLLGQSPVDFIQKASGRRYGTQKWLRIVSIAGGTILGGTIAAQFGFGKIRNPHNIQKQVKDDANS